MTAHDMASFGAQVVAMRRESDLEWQRRLRSKLRDDLRDLDYLEGAWPYVCELRARGTPKHWVGSPRRPPSMLITERLSFHGLRGTPRPAPADVSTLDVLSKIADTVVWIHAELCRTLPYRREIFHPPVSAYRDPRPWLRLIAHWMPQAHAATRLDDEPIVVWVERRLADVVDVVARLLHDVRDGQELDAICPWCLGRTSTAAASERTLRVHYPSPTDLDHARPLDELVDPDVTAASALIVCHGLNCSPPLGTCGASWHDKPAWPIREWDWLAKQLFNTD